MGNGRPSVTGPRASGGSAARSIRPLPPPSDRPAISSPLTPQQPKHPLPLRSQGWPPYSAGCRAAVSLNVRGGARGGRGRDQSSAEHLHADSTGRSGAGTGRGSVAAGCPRQHRT
eukprot:1647414-Prymnesium_polylepis.1